MNAQTVQLSLDVRVWQDERSGQYWHLAYHDGDSETRVSFPDTAALGDFLADRLGLNVVDALRQRAVGCYSCG